MADFKTIVQSRYRNYHEDDTIESAFDKINGELEEIMIDLFKGSYSRLDPLGYAMREFMIEYQEEFGGEGSPTHLVACLMAKAQAHLYIQEVISDMLCERLQDVSEGTA